MQTLDKHFRKLTEPVFQKHGFAQGDVLSHWPTIVGEQLAAITRPEKLRQGRTEGAGATLYLKVQAGRSLDVEYAAQSIMERVNTFLGFRAVTGLKLSQVHGLLLVPTLKPAAPAIPDTVSARVAPIADPELQAALARLGASVSASKTRSPQVK